MKALRVTDGISGGNYLKGFTQRRQDAEDAKGFWRKAHAKTQRTQREEGKVKEIRDKRSWSSPRISQMKMDCTEKD